MYTDIDEYLPKELSLEICLCAIHELMEQLLILKTINNWPDINIQNFRYKSPQDRFENRVFQDKDFENIIPKRCDFIVSLFKNLVDELRKERSYAEFSRIVSILVRMESDEKNLLDEAVNKKMNLKTIQTKLEKEKITYVNKILNCMAEIGHLKDQIENFQIESEIKLVYIKSWQNSKLEMDAASAAEILHNTNQTINQTISKINIENRVHENYVNAMTEFQEDFEEKVVNWKNKYYETLETMIQKINKLQGKQNKQLEVITSLKNMYDTRQTEIQDWNAYKIEQERIRVEKEKRNKTATKIQAWWRGTMVRKGFGKFRRKKEKKPKKSSEKSTAKK